MSGCPKCHGVGWLRLEPRLQIPCPVCQTEEAAAAVGRAVVIVQECQRIDQEGAMPAERGLAWVRVQTRPFPAYTSRWRGQDAPIWTVCADREWNCWRANRGAGTVADQHGGPKVFDSMETAMGWCERAAADEEKARRQAQS